jgi:hypothetical protein
MVTIQEKKMFPISSQPDKVAPKNLSFFHQKPILYNSTFLSTSLRPFLKPIHSLPSTQPFPWILPIVRLLTRPGSRVRRIPSWPVWMPLPIALNAKIHLLL